MITASTMYLLDTDHFSILQRQHGPEYNRLKARIRLHPVSSIYVSIVSFQEQVSGWNAYLNRATSTHRVVHAYEMFQQILKDFSTAQCAAFDQNAAKIFDGLRQQRIRVATLDLRIAAIALSRGMTLLTRNLVDFGKVPGLSVDDWTRS